MTTKRKILVVEDDADLRTELAEQLDLHDEFEAAQAGAAQPAIAHVRGDHVDLILMDVGLPDMDGREAIKIMRRDGYRGPVIMLTGRGSRPAA